MIKGDPGVEDIYKWGASMNIPTRGASGQGEVGDGTACTGRQSKWCGVDEQERSAHVLHSLQVDWLESGWH